MSNYRLPLTWNGGEAKKFTFQTKIISNVNQNIIKDRRRKESRPLITGLKGMWNSALPLELLEDFRGFQVQQIALCWVLMQEIGGAFD